MIKKKLVVWGVVDMHQLLLKADVTQLLDSIIDENSTVLPDKICKDLFMQALVRIQNHCKKVNMQNILKPCEIYFHHVIHTDLFPLGSGEFHGFANIVRITKECWNFLWFYW